MERKPPTLLRVRKAGRYGRLPLSATQNLFETTWRILAGGPNRKPKLLIQLPLAGTLSLFAVSLRSTLTAKLGSAFEVHERRTASHTSAWLSSLNLSQPISYLTRTPNGRGILAVGTQGQHTVWTIGTQAEGAAAMGRLAGRAQWTASPSGPPQEGGNGATCDREYIAAIFAGGRGFVRAGHGDRVTLHHVDDDGTVTSGIDLPDLVSSDRISV